MTAAAEVHAADVETLAAAAEATTDPDLAAAYRAAAVARYEQGVGDPPPHSMVAALLRHARRTTKENDP